MPATVNYGNLPFKEAISFFKGKVKLPTERWSDLVGGMHSRAFVVAGAQKSELVSDMYSAIQEAIDGKLPLADFRKRFDVMVQKHGWSYKGSRGWRTSTIYHTNLATAQSAGRYKQMTDPETLKAFPYWRYRTLDGGNRRPLHQKWKNTVLPANDPWWNTHFTPNGWNCFPPGTLVRTPTGWRPIEQISVGDPVVGGSGNVKPVTFVHKTPYDGEIIRVILECSSSFSLTPNHRVLTMRGWVSADSLHSDDELVQIIQASGLDNPVVNINHPDTTRDNCSVPFPVERETAACDAIDTKSKVRDKNVEPVGFDVDVEERLETKQLLNMQTHRSLGTRLAHPKIWVFGWIDKVLKPFGVSHLRLHLRPSRRSGKAQLLSHPQHKYSVGLVGYLSNVTALLRHYVIHFCQSFPLHASALRVVNPLKTDRFTPGTGLDSEVLHQIEKSVVAHSPSGTQSFNPEILDVVEPNNGSGSGAPFSGFNSLDSFRTWARSHCVLLKVSHTEYTPYTGKVFNLSVNGDESYCIPQCVVHNCQCWIETVSSADYKQMQNSSTFKTETPNDGTYTWKNPSTGETSQVPKGIDPGWDYNPGRAAWGEPLAEKAMTSGKVVYTPLTTTDWRTFDRPEHIPVDEITASLGPETLTAESLRSQIEKTIGGPEKVFTYPQGDFNHPLLVNAAVLARRVELWRGKYVPLMGELLADPFEIWASFEQNPLTGKVVLRERVIKGVNADKKGLVSVFEAEGGKLVSWTFIPSDKLSYLQKQRHGKLIWSRK